MSNIKTILAGLSLTMAVGMPAVASDELTSVRDNELYLKAL